MESGIWIFKWTRLNHMQGTLLGTGVQKLKFLKNPVPLVWCCLSSSCRSFKCHLSRFLLYNLKKNMHLETHNHYYSKSTLIECMYLLSVCFGVCMCCRRCALNLVWCCFFFFFLTLFFRNIIMRELAPQFQIPWSIPLEAEDIPIVPTTSGTM